MKKRAEKSWFETTDAHMKWKAAREEAQKRADETGFDHGIERNDLFKSFSVFMLPRRENRRGYELRSEVVSSSDISKCQPGHGPSGVFRCPSR